MVEKDLQKLAQAACLRGDKVHSLAVSLAEVGTMMQDAGAWADTLDVEELPVPGFGIVVYPDGFTKTESDTILRADIHTPFEGDVLSASERLTGEVEQVKKIAGEKYVSVPKVIGGKEQA